MAEHHTSSSPKGAQTSSRIEDELDERFTPLLAERGYDLYEVTYRRERRGWILRFTVDRHGGNLTIEEGVKLSRELSAAIDADPRLDHLLSGPYHLEVSSPGIFRTLSRARDFERSWGKRIKVIWKEPSEGRVMETVGKLAGYGEGKLTLRTEADQLLEIDHGSIQSVRLEPELPFGRN